MRAPVPANSSPAGQPQIRCSWELLRATSESEDQAAPYFVAFEARRLRTSAAHDQANVASELRLDVAADGSFGLGIPAALAAFADRRADPKRDALWPAEAILMDATTTLD
jgi:hypothetical protein